MNIFIDKVIDNLKDCIIKRCLIVSSKSHLVTLTYLFDAIKLLNNYPKIDGLALEGYFYETETKSTTALSDSVLKEI